MRRLVSAMRVSFRAASGRLTPAPWIRSVLVLSAAQACSVGDASYTADRGTPVNLVDLQSGYCVGTCLPDYGSERTQCWVDDGLEFFPVDVLDGESGSITGFYSYNDGTASYMVSGPGPYSLAQSTYQPPAVTTSGLCNSDNQIGDSAVHHIRGGLFREWGGGMGRRLVNFVTPGGVCPAGPSRPEDPEYCPDADERVEKAIADGVIPSVDSAQFRTDFYGMMVDLRGWDGISFWARQGPNNTAGIRVYLGDRQLDEDIAFLEERAGLEPSCRRARECGCNNHQPCTESAAGVWICFDPDEIGPDAIDTARTAALNGGQLDVFERAHPLCGPSACDDINDAFQTIDPVFATPNRGGTAQCRAYKLTSDLEDYFCFDESNPASFPPDGPERCGDGWAKGVSLGNNWQFYKIPFTELRQEGYGKEFSYLDLSKITLVRFTWMQGWVDVWLDDVRFYREALAVGAAAAH